MASSSESVHQSAWNYFFAARNGYDEEVQMALAHK
jgi:hypothetical protein